MVKIIADTTSCISPAEAKALGIHYIPQLIVFGEETYRDDCEMDSRQFLKRLRGSQVLPKTAAPPPALYMPIYRELASQGHAMVVIVPPQNLSGTYRSAVTAREDFLQECPQADIRVIDTKIIAGGLGAVVKQALRWAESGMDADTIVANIEEMCLREKVFFLVDTLEFLYRGGRIGAAKALFGSLLQVKPILTIHQGQVEAVESQRTHRRGLERLKELVLQDCPHSPDAHICLMHGDAEDLAQTIAREMAEILGIPAETVPVYDLTPAILTHSGPGVIGISYYVAKGENA